MARLPESITVLVVEDHEINRELLIRRLNRVGYPTRSAVDGKQAIDEVRRLAPDIILLDLSLPFVDGWQVAGILKSDPVTASIPIVAVTAHAMRGDRERALEAGCDEYATKPLDFPRLLGLIEHFTNR